MRIALWLLCLVLPVGAEKTPWSQAVASANLGGQLTRAEVEIWEDRMPTMVEPGQPAPVRKPMAAVRLKPERPGAVLDYLWLRQGKQSMSAPVKQNTARELTVWHEKLPVECVVRVRYAGKIWHLRTRSRLQFAF